MRFFLTSLSLVLFNVAAFAMEPLNVPYYKQAHNRYEPHATCGITSGAMLVSYFTGKKVTPDSLYEIYGKPQGTTPEGLAEIYRDYGLYAYATRKGSRAEIKNHLLNGRVVVVHGWFTSNGHIMPFIGMDDRGFIANDPAGIWKGCVRCGYNPGTIGGRVPYSYSSLSSQVLGADGEIWYSVASRANF